MSNQYKMCETCIQRHCRKSPVKKGEFYSWVCPKYRKHQAGFKMREVMHGKETQMPKV